MTFAGFFVHLSSIPPVLRWLQWLNPLKYTLEALSVNEVGSGLMIQDTLQGVPVDVSATLIMQLVSLCLKRSMTGTYISCFHVAFRVWSEQLLPGCSRAVCIHRWVRYWSYWRRVASDAGEEVVIDMASKPFFRFCFGL